MVTLTRTIPALRVRDVAVAVAFYGDRLGFDVLYLTTFTEEVDA
jgi:catechol 2,3-dioxygenase-like lactoylglutathione lyase family enzyme